MAATGAGAEITMCSAGGFFSHRQSPDKSLLPFSSHANSTIIYTNIVTYCDFPNTTNTPAATKK